MRARRGAAATLLFRASCGKCRLLSGLAVLVSLGSVRRIPLDSPEAQRLYALHRETRGKLALVDGDRMTTGWTVVPRALRLAAAAWLQAVLK